MHVLRADGNYGVVMGWTVVPGTQVMYNLEVAQDHRFTVGVEQWVVHNCTPGDQLPDRTKGGPTRGVLVNDSTQTDLFSGSGGPADRMPPDTPGMGSNFKTERAGAGP